jgi:chromosome segregation ATPase
MDDLSSTERVGATRTQEERDLDRANLDIKSMRSSLSMLTSASSQLAATLEKRNQEYDALLARQAEFNRRLEALQTELNLASAERTDLKGQVNERNAQQIEIQGRLDRLQSDFEAAAADKTALETQLADVQGELERRAADLDSLTASQAELTAQLEGMTAARLAAEEKLRTSQIQLADLESQLAALESDLRGVLPAEPEAADSEEVRTGAPRVVIEEVPPEAPEARQAAQVGAVAAAVASLIVRNTETDAKLQDTTAQLAALSEKLQAGEAELDGLEQQLTTWQDELQKALPAPPVADEVAPDEAAESLEATLEEQPNEEAIAETPEVAEATPPETPAARRAAKVVAVSSAVAGVVLRSAETNALLQETAAQVAVLNEQAEALAAEKAGLEETLQEKDARIERLSGSLTFLQAQLDGTILGKNEIESKLRARETEIDDLQAQIGAWQSDLQTVLPEAAAAEAAEAVAEPGEAPAPEKPEAHRAAKAAALGSALAAVVARSKDTDAKLEETAARLAAAEASLQEKEQALAVARDENVSLEDQLNGVAAQKASLEATLQEKEAELADLRGQLETLQTKLAEMQTEVAEAAPFQEATALAASLEGMGEAKRSAATAAIVAGVQPQITDRLQPLTRVRGIGRAFRRRLYNAGVGTYWELASLSDDELGAVLKLSPMQAERISLEEIRADALGLARETDTVGQIWQGHQVDEFEPMEGIGNVMEERLYDAGICTFEQLATTTPEQLAEICHAPEMSQPDYGGWIEYARKIADERQKALEAEAVG